MPVAAELDPELCGTVRNDWMQQNRDCTDQVRGRVENSLQARAILLSVGRGEFPRLLLHKVAVDRGNSIPDAKDRHRHEKRIRCALVVCDKLLLLTLPKEGLLKVLFRFCERALGFWNAPITVTVNHRDRSVRQVSQIISKVRVVAVNQPFIGEIRILSEGRIAQQIVAQGVVAGRAEGIERIHNRVWIDHVALRLRHLVLLVVNPPVGKDGLGQRQTGSHQERRPVNRMEAQDVLADHVQVGGPEFLEIVASLFTFCVTHAGHVARERVIPDVNHLIGIIRPWDTPLQSPATDRDVSEAALDEADHFIAPVFGLHKLGVVPVKLQQALLKCGESKEIVLFIDQFRRAAADVAIGRVGAVGNVALIINAVTTLVLTLIDHARLILLRKANQALNARDVLRLVGIDKVRVLNAEFLPEFDEELSLLRHEFRWLHACCFCCPLQFFTVLVRPGQVSHIIAAHALVARDDVTNNRGVGGANMRPRIRIVKRCRQIKFAHCLNF